MTAQTTDQEQKVGLQSARKLHLRRRRDDFALGQLQSGVKPMKQIRRPDTGQILQEYDDPDPLRDAIQELLNDRLIEFHSKYRNGSLVCDDRP